MFKVNVFPDGQINVTVEQIQEQIDFRISSYEDLFILKSISEVYKNNHWDMPSLVIPCLFGQQSDRRFGFCESFDLKIICDFINSCDFKSVTIIDPHSDVGPALINNSIIKKPDSYIYLVFHHIPKDTILVSPDAGAYKKVFSLANNLNRELVAANKFRDKDGNINLNFMGDVSGKNCLIVDDLAVYGGTFKKLSTALRSNGANKVYLYVTHFKGAIGTPKMDIVDDLLNYVDRFFCTTTTQCLLDTSVMSVYNYAKHSDKNFYQISY